MDFGGKVVGSVLPPVVYSAIAEAIYVVGTTRVETRIARSAIESLRQATASIMPEGMDKSLGPEKLRDLLTFLLTQPLQPAPLLRDGAPPPTAPVAWPWA